MNITMPFMTFQFMNIEFADMVQLRGGGEGIKP